MDAWISAIGALAVAVVALVGSYASATRLPLQDRRLLNAASALEKAGGSSAPSTLTLLVTTLASRVSADVEAAQRRRSLTVWLTLWVAFGLLGAYVAFLFDWPSAYALFPDLEVSLAWFIVPRVTGLCVFIAGSVAAAIVSGRLALGSAIDPEKTTKATPAESSGTNTGGETAEHAEEPVATSP